MRHPMPSSVAVSVGLDYSEAAVRVCVLGPDGDQQLNRDLPNDAAVIAAAVQRQAGADSLRGCAIEACCGAADLALVSATTCLPQEFSGITVAHESGTLIVLYDGGST